MKNKISKFICISSILLSGCSTISDNQSTADKHTPAKEDIIVTGGGVTDLMVNFEKFEDCLTYSDAIIYGEISDFETAATPGSGFIYTLQKIHVLETLYGDIEADQDIMLREVGGYVLINDFLNAFDIEEEKQGYRTGMFGHLSDQELAEKYVSEVPEGYYYPEIGERAVFCIKQSNVSEGEYAVAGSWQGIYRETEDGVLATPGTSSSLTDPERKYSGETITYEDLKNQIQKAAALISN